MSYYDFTFINTFFSTKFTSKVIRKNKHSYSAKFFRDVDE